MKIATISKIKGLCFTFLQISLMSGSEEDNLMLISASAFNILFWLKHTKKIQSLRDR